MLRTRLRKIYRDIGSRKGRTALVATSIFVGVLGVITLTSVSEILLDKLRNDLREDEIRMLTAFVELEDEAVEMSDAELFNTLRDYPNITAVEGWKLGRIFWKESGDDSFIESTLRSFSEPMDNLQIEPVRLIEGEYPTAGQKQLVIERRMSDRYGLEIGDEITVRIISGLDASNFTSDGTVPEETWTISGIVFHPYTFNGASTAYTTGQDLTYISGSENYGRLVARFEDFRNAQDSVEGLELPLFEDWVESETPYKVNSIGIENPAESDFISEIEQWSETLSTLAIVAMLVASFLVVTVINTILVEQKRQIGVMKSIGATQPDNFKIYSGVALTYGLIGTLPAVPLGIFAGYQLTLRLAPLANILVEDFTLAPTALIVGGVMGLGVPVLASALPVYFGTRVSILSAMTDLGISSSYGTGIVARLINRLPFSPAIRQALANISQKQGRLALTGLTLTLAVGAFMGVTAVFLSLNNVVEDIYSTFNFAISVGPDEKTDFDLLSALILENVEEVATVTPSHAAGLTILNVPAESINLNNDVNENSIMLFMEGFDTSTNAIQAKLIAGEGWANDSSRSGVVLAKDTAENMDKTVGDVLTAIQDGKIYEIEVIGIADLPFDQYGLMRWQDVAAMTDEDDADRPASMLIQLKDENASAAEVDKAIGEIRELLLKNGITANFANQIAFREEDNNLILTVGMVFNIASLVMAAIGAIGLLISLSISVFERQREIGVMRSVGAGTGTIITQFLTEGLLIGGLAWLIGVPVSYGIGQLLQAALPVEFDFRYPPISLVLGLVGMLIVAFTASIWPSISASRKTVSDILRYQ